MPTMTKYVAGTFCWPELGTTDAAAAKKFYAGLFDWSTVDMPIPGGAPYTMIKKDDRDVGAMYTLNEEQTKHGIPPHWLSYIATDDVDATLEKIKANGGNVLMGPMDVKPDGTNLVGRMAAVTDPEGAAFAIWQAGSHCGATIVNEPGSLAWNELMTRDAAAAKKFYSAVFGWNLQEMEMSMGPYTVVSVGERPNGGIMTMPEGAGDAPAHWLAYFAVDDCDARAKKAESLGGKFILQPMDIPDIGRMAVLQDPQGAMFAIMWLKNPTL
jgi:predicted enzyme related to lactoylglutathione lyase